MCNKCKDAGKRGGDILPSYRFCPLVKYFRVHLVSTFPFFMHSPHIRATVQIRSVFKFIFLSGGLRDQMGDHGEGSAIIYDYFFKSVYACRLCKTQRRPSMAWVRANLSPTIIFSDDAVGKYSRTFTAPRVVPFCSYLFYFLFYYPLNVQPRLQTFLQTSAPCFFLAWTLVDGGARGTVSLNSSASLSPTLSLLTYFRIPIRKIILPTLLYVLCSKCTYTSCTRLPSIPDESDSQIPPTNAWLYTIYRTSVEQIVF